MNFKFFTFYFIIQCAIIVVVVFIFHSLLCRAVRSLKFAFCLCSMKWTILNIEWHLICIFDSSREIQRKARKSERQREGEQNKPLHGMYFCRALRLNGRKMFHLSIHWKCQCVLLLLAQWAPFSNTSLRYRAQYAANHFPFFSQICRVHWANGVKHRVNGKNHFPSPVVIIHKSQMDMSFYYRNAFSTHIYSLHIHNATFLLFFQYIISLYKYSIEWFNLLCVLKASGGCF